jgi:hypothetical protein
MSARKVGSVAPQRRLTLAPLSFDEALTDLLKVKPEPKLKSAMKQMASSSSERGKRQGRKG